MDNETTAAEPQAGATAPSQPQAGVPSTTEPQAGESHQETISLDEAKKLRSESFNLRKRLKTFEDADEKLKTERKAAEDAQLSENERLKKQHAELQAKYDAEVRTRQEITNRHAITNTATTLNFAYPDIAYKLIDDTSFERDESGNITNAEDLLKKLLTRYPDLAKKEQQQEQPTELAQPTQPRTPAIPAMNPGRSNIQPANSTPNRPYRLSEVYPKP